MISAELLSGIVGLGISLALSYLPGLSPRWDALDGTKKRFLTGLFVVGAGLGVYALGCQTAYALPIACPEPVNLAGAILAALVANQSIYSVTNKG